MFKKKYNKPNKKSAGEGGSRRRYREPVPLGFE